MKNIDSFFKLMASNMSQKGAKKSLKKSVVLMKTGGGTFLNQTG